MVGTKYRKQALTRHRARPWRAAAIWLVSSTALAGFAVSGWPPAAAAASRPAPAAASRQASAARLVISPAVQRQLRALYAAYRHIPLASIAPAASGPALGARLRRGADWAMIRWQPSSRAGLAMVAGFQDGAGTGTFTRAAGGRWAVAGLGGEPAGCAVAIPAAVRRLWHLPGCPAPARPSLPRGGGAVAGGTALGLVAIALAQAGVSDNPPVTSFSGLDCNPYTTLVGNPLGASSKGCKTSSNGTYFSNVQDTSEFWCADFTKWVWARAGVTSGLATLTPSAASFYTWGVDHGETITFAGTPRIGNAVLLYPPSTKAPNGSYADHVGIVTAVHANGTLNLINGDFLGSSNISVQYNTNVYLPTWASQVEGSPGEKWAFVSPRLPRT